MSSSQRKLGSILILFCNSKCKSNVKMDPSFRWDDEVGFLLFFESTRIYKVQASL